MSGPEVRIALAGLLMVREDPFTYTKSTPVLLDSFWYSSSSSSRAPPIMKALL